MRDARHGLTLVEMTAQSEHSTHTIGSTTVVVLRGDLDLHTHTELQAVLRKVDGSGTDDVMIDLGQAGFIDSTGVCALLSLAYAVRQRAGRVRLRGASKRDLFVLDVRGGLGMFDGTSARSDRWQQVG